jgi:hypothetical protein
VTINNIILYLFVKLFRKYYGNGHAVNIFFFHRLQKVIMGAIANVQLKLAHMTYNVSDNTQCTTNGPLTIVDQE